MELGNCLTCGHSKEIHYDGPAAWPGRLICLVDNCNCRDFKIKEKVNMALKKKGVAEPIEVVEVEADEKTGKIKVKGKKVKK